MPQIKTRSARKTYTCQMGCTISPGETYYSAKPYRAPKKIRCKDHPFAPGEAEGGSRGELVAIEAAISALDVDLREDVSSVGDELSNIAEQVRGVAEEYQEKASNIEDGFGHSTYMSDEFQDQASELESWADEIESAADELRGLAGESVCTCEHTEEYHIIEEVDGVDQPVCTECDDAHEYVEDESWKQDAEDYIGGVSSCPI